MATQEEEFEEFFKELEEETTENTEEQKSGEQKDEEEKALTKEDVIKIVRDELKTFWQGVLSGKYPLPKVAKYPYAKYPYAVYPYAKYPAPGAQKSIEADEVPVMPFFVVPQMVDTTSAPAQTDNTKSNEKDKVIEEQKSQIEELKKTVDELQKKLEELSAQPAPEETKTDSNDTKTVNYVSDVVIEGDTISRP
ncbi:MAG: hypothetical protein QIT36_gp088 [Methanophagales virus GBV301]|uniref:Uncharacterized protein n=1 Tax=Methanophagales virus GBV301 TaxID=2999280 RepID=A0A9E8V800_9CAUD|nr:MAG: hypothetical protein QIT36_gp088 [Methanophagales virus GBV301]WAE39512.1 MAG: hypothetical protein LDLAKGPJ_00088 [Methanophagales virus GBV301]